MAAEAVNDRVAEALRLHLSRDPERGSPLTVALLEGAFADWDAGGITRQVLGPFGADPSGSALPLRFTAALHRLVLTRQAPELAVHYATVGGTAPPSGAWPAARRVLSTHTTLVRELVALPCQTNEVGRAVPLLIGLLTVARRTGSELRLLEIGASAGLNLLVDQFRYGQRYGPADSPCLLPDPGVDVDGAELRIVDRGGCDPAPLDPTSRKGRLGLSASIWGDQPERFGRLQGALAVAAQYRVPVERAGAADWLHRQLSPTRRRPAVPASVVWHSIVRTYLDPAEWTQVERLTAQAGVWRLSYEPDPEGNPQGVPLRLFDPDSTSDGEVLAYGGGHGPPVTLA